MHNNNYNRNLPPVQNFSNGWYTPGYSNSQPQQQHQDFNQRNFNNSQQSYNNNYHQFDQHQQAAFRTQPQPGYNGARNPFRGRGSIAQPVRWRGPPPNTAHRSFPGPPPFTNKRPHALVARNQGETSPTPKRILQKHSSFEFPRPGNSSKKQTDALPQQSPKKQTNSPLQQSPKKQQKKPVVDNPCKQIQDKKDAKWNELFAHALKVLEECQAGQEIKVLLAYLQPSESEWSKTKEQIYRELYNLMSPLGLEKLTVFGSSVTGLDFIGSDLDYHIKLKDPPEDEDSARQAIQRAAKLTRQSHGNHFRTIFTVQHARVPIIRLHHLRSNTTCDVNFTSEFGFHNSRFICTVLNFDTRIKDLAIFLKLWSKSYKLTEKMVLSNYCLQMLMIFYLQNLPQPMLDSLKSNQNRRQAYILHSRFKWNFYFNETINLTAQNHQTFRELLEGFFDFYSKINVSDNIVSLYNGKLIPRRSFDDHPDLVDYRLIVLESSLPAIKHDNPQTFIVQDAFELNVNIGIKCQKHLDLFFGLIKQSAAKCTEMTSQPLSKLMAQLFTELKLPEVENKNEVRSKKKFLMTIHAIAGDLKVRTASNENSNFSQITF